MKFYYITMNELVGLTRRKRTVEEMKKVDYPTEEFIGVRKYDRQTGCSYSHFLVALKERKSGAYGIFEDDVKILDADKLNKQVETALKDKDWDVFYLSFHPPRQEFKIIGENKDHYEIEGMLGTHAVMFRPNAIKQFLLRTEPTGFVDRQVNIDIAIRDSLPLRCFCPKELAVSIWDGPSIRAAGSSRLNTDEQIIRKFNDKINTWKRTKTK